MEKYIVVCNTEILTKKPIPLNEAEDFVNKLVQDKTKVYFDQNIYICKMEPYVCLRLGISRDIVAPNTEAYNCFINMSGPVDFQEGELLKIREDISLVYLDQNSGEPVKTLSWNNNWAKPGEIIKFIRYGKVEDKTGLRNVVFMSKAGNQTVILETCVARVRNET